jgi:hypothetical protein
VLNNSALLQSRAPSLNACTHFNKEQMYADTRQRISCEYVYVSDWLVIYFDLLSFCQEIIGGLLDHTSLCLSSLFIFLLIFPKLCMNVNSMEQSPS